MTEAATPALEPHALHQALVRPRLLMGVDRRLFVANLAGCAVLAVVGKTLTAYALAAALGWAVHKGLQRLTRIEPYFLDIWKRHNAQQPAYAARARFEAPTPARLPQKGFY